MSLHVVKTPTDVALLVGRALDEEDARAQSNDDDAEGHSLDFLPPSLPLQQRDASDPELSDLTDLGEGEPDEQKDNGPTRKRKRKRWAIHRTKMVQS